MRFQLLLPIIAVVLTAADGDDAAKKELAKLQGSWETSSLTYNGKDHAADAKFRFVFKGDQVTVTGNQAVERDYAKFKVKLDPSTTPRCVDITITGGGQLDATLEGIYDVKDDDFRLCVKVFGKDRPLEFASPDGSSIALLVMKRVSD